MALVPAKCTSCGAALQVDSAKDAAICQHCGSAFVVQKAISQYHVNAAINAGTVNVYTSSPDFVVRAGVLEKYNGAETDVVIPTGVKIIGEKAFEGCVGLTSVTIPEGVAEIGCSAFSGCTRLQQVRLTEGLRCIGIHAFNDCKALEAITLPASTLTVGEFAFEGCSGLKTLTIRSGRTQFLVWKSPEMVFNFSGCSSLTAIDFPDMAMTRELEYCFNGSAWYYMRHHCCTFCGNAFKGVFHKVCTFCRRPKNY